VTAPYKASLRFKGDHTQWADCGVNVGHTVNGGVHFHLPFPVDVPSQPWSEAASRVPVMRHEAARSALFALVRACERAVAALLSADLIGPERRSDDIE